MATSVSTNERYMQSLREYDTQISVNQYNAYAQQQNQLGYIYYDTKVWLDSELPAGLLAQLRIEIGKWHGDLK